MKIISSKNIQTQTTVDRFSKFNKGSRAQRPMAEGYCFQILYINKCDVLLALFTHCKVNGPNCGRSMTEYDHAGMTEYGHAVWPMQ